MPMACGDCAGPEIVSPGIMTDQFAGGFRAVRAAGFFLEAKIRSRQISAFVNSIEHDLPSPVPGEQARTRYSMLAAMDSQETGAVLRLRTSR